MTTPANTLVTQDRIQTLMPDGSRKYSIYSICTTAGELLHTDIFVHEIMDEADPTHDVFIRVASPYDLQNLKHDRNAAVAAHDQYVLLPECRLLYEDIAVAVQAKSAFDTRINELIASWFAYKNDFNATGDVIYYPTADPAFEQALIDAYVSARDARIAAEATVVATTATVTSATAASTTAQSLVDVYKREVDFCVKAYKTDWDIWSDAVTPTLTNAISAFVSLADQEIAYIASPLPAFVTGVATFKTAFSTFNLQLPYKTDLDLQFSTFYGSANSGYSAALSDKQVKDKAVADAVIAKEKAEASLTLAQTREDAALAAIRSICPTFDPSTV
jgi:hypothetical protein